MPMRRPAFPPTGPARRGPRCRAADRECSWLLLTVMSVIATLLAEPATAMAPVTVASSADTADDEPEPPTGPER